MWIAPRRSAVRIRLAPFRKSLLSGSLLYARPILIGELRSVAAPVVSMTEAYGLRAEVERRATGPRGRVFPIPFLLLLFSQRALARHRGLGRRWRLSGVLTA